MSILLTTAVDEGCQAKGFLRGRRRSSVYPTSAIPRVFSTTQLTTAPLESGSDHYNDSAVVDDPEAISCTFDASPGDSINSPMTSITHVLPLSHAHVSDHASEMIVRKSIAPAGMSSSPPTLGESSKATITVNTIASSASGYPEPLGVGVVPPEQLAEMPDPSEVEKTPERKNWRLAAGYFAFFMCGWGDGSKSFLNRYLVDLHLLMILLLLPPVTGTVLPCKPSS